MSIPIISIVSKKNCGKTTLLEKLIPVLKQRGYRIGIIKHDVHGFDIDHEGKDTYRHKAAGADTVAISCPFKLSLVKDVAKEWTPDELREEYFSDVDIVLTEGYKQSKYPQIEVYRKDAHHEPLYANGRKHSLIAFVSDVPMDMGVPNFDINDVQAVADLIENEYLKIRSTNTEIRNNA